MEITITGRHYEVDSELESYIDRELTYLEDKYKRFDDAQVILIKEKYRQIAEITLHADGHRYLAKEESDDMYVSIDNAVAKVETQVKKFREKRRETSRHHHKGEEENLGERDKYLEEELGETVIVPVDLHMAKPMVEEEAAMQLKMSNNIFMPFINAKTGRMNVIYKRTDGDIGLIQPPQ